MSQDRDVSRGARLVRWAIALLIVASLSAMFLFALPFEVVRGRLDAYAGDGSAEPYTPALHQRLRLACGAAALVCGGLAGGFIAGRRRAAALFDAAQTRRRRDAAELAVHVRRLCRGMAGWCTALAVFAAVVRVPYLDMPLRFDEAYTFNEYASQPWFVTVSKYDAPNNHVLHSVLVWLSTHLWGDAAWAIRLPALVAGVALVPLTMLLARAVGGVTAAILAGLTVASSSPLIEYSVNARGYTLMCAVTVAGWGLTIFLARRSNVVAWAGWCVCAALGCWVVPVMVYSIGMQAAWLCRQGFSAAARREYPRGAFRSVFVALCVAGTATLLLYLPVLLVSGPRAVFASASGAASGPVEIVPRIGNWLRDMNLLLLRDLPAPVLVLLTIGLAASCRHRSPSVRRARAAALASICVPPALIVVQRVLPFPRVFLFLLPLASVMSAVGLSQLVRRLPHRAARRTAIALIALCLAAWPLWEMHRQNSILESPEGGTLVDAERIIRDLAGELRPAERIVAVSPSSAQLAYYARRQGMDRHRFDRPDSSPEQGESAIVVVNRTVPQSRQEVLRELALAGAWGDCPARLIKRYPSADVYRIEQP